MIEGTPMENESSMLEIAKYAKKVGNTGLFNNAAQSYNHAFYWACMHPNGGGAPDRTKHAKLSSLIDRDFGSFESFSTQFVDAGSTLFGSGWVWLIHGNAGLEVSVFLHNIALLLVKRM